MWIHVYLCVSVYSTHTNVIGIMSAILKEAEGAYTIAKTENLTIGSRIDHGAVSVPLQM